MSPASSVFYLKTFQATFEEQLVVEDLEFQKENLIQMNRATFRDMMERR